MAVVVNVYGKASLAQLDRAQAQLAGMRKEAAAQAGPWKSMGSAISSTWAKIGSTVAAVMVAKWLKGSLDAARAYQLGLAQLRTAVVNTTAGGAAAWGGYERADEARWSPRRASSPPTPRDSSRARSRRSRR